MILLFVYWLRFAISTGYGSVTITGGVAPGGAAGMAGIAGTAGVVGVEGIAGTAGTAGTAGLLGLCGASAAMLLVRKVTLLSRAFITGLEDCCSPPAAGSISSSQAPHLVTESTYSAVSASPFQAAIDVPAKDMMVAASTN